MIISLKVRVPKITEDDILLNTPLPTRPEDIIWVWRRKGMRSADIMNIEMLDKNISIVSYWDFIEDKPAKYVVKEAFDEIMLKWEKAETTLLLPDKDEAESEEDNPSQDSDED